MTCTPSDDVHATTELHLQLEHLKDRAAIYKVPAAGLAQIFAFIGLLEWRNSKFPTDYGYPPFTPGAKSVDAADRDRKLLAEINNGRLAMMAVES